LFGNERQTTGMDTTFTLSSPSTDLATQYISVHLILYLNAFNAATDILEIFEGDANLQGDRLFSFNGKGIFTIYDRNTVVNVSSFLSVDMQQQEYTFLLLCQQVSFNFRSRDTNGTHFALSYTMFTECPVGYLWDNSIVKCAKILPIYHVPAYPIVIVFISNIFGIMCVFAMLCFVYLYRNYPQVRVMNQPMSCFLLLCNLFIFVDGLLFAIEPEGEHSSVCHLRIWVGCVAIVGYLAAMSSTAIQLCAYFLNRTLNPPKCCSNSYLLLFSGLMIGIEICMLCVFSAAGGTHNILHVGLRSDLAEYSIWYCTPLDVQNPDITWSVFFIFHLIYAAGFVVYGIYFTFRFKTSSDVSNFKTDNKGNEINIDASMRFIYTLTAFFLFLLIFLLLNIFDTNSVIGDMIMRGMMMCFLGFSFLH
jgi:hypothetical protein